VASIAWGSDWKDGRMGRGSVGLDILGRLAEPVLVLGSGPMEIERGSDVFLPNHFEGFERKWEMLEGELERASGKVMLAGEEGVDEENASCGLKVLKD
jgi:hypothetical protein